MHENPQFRPVEVHKLEVDQSFKPFENLHLPSRIEYNSELATVVSTEITTFPVEFKGIHGRILLETDDSAEEAEDLETPLGEVRIAKVFDNNDVYFSEVPLVIGIAFDIHHLSENELLAKYRCGFSLAGEDYYLDCASDELPRLIERETQQDGVFTTNSYSMYTKDGNGHDAVFPYESGKLTPIVAKFTEKPVD